MVVETVGPFANTDDVVAVIFGVFDEIIVREVVSSVDDVDEIVVGVNVSSVVLKVSVEATITCPVIDGLVLVVVSSVVITGVVVEEVVVPPVIIK